MLLQQLRVLSGEVNGDAIWGWALQVQAQYIPGGIYNTRHVRFRLRARRMRRGSPVASKSGGRLCLPHPPGNLSLYKLIRSKRTIEFAGIRPELVHRVHRNPTFAKRNSQPSVHLSGLWKFHGSLVSKVRSELLLRPVGARSLSLSMPHKLW